MNMKFEKNTFNKRMKSMLSVDFRRMFTMPLYYIMIGISLVMPILILVMTTMMDGTVTTDPQTGAQTVMEGFKTVWQIIGTSSGDSSAMGMSLTSMCNINMMFFIIAVFVAIFVTDDFRSGYAKNLFTVRSKKSDYAISKAVVAFVAGASMLIAFFIGSMIGGAIAGLPFALEGATAVQVVMCMFSKIFLVGIFVAIYMFASIVSKQKLWLALILSFVIGMLFFTMIPMVTPLNSGIINVILCLVGSVGFCALFVWLSSLILNKLDIL
ncbi:MAG: ABC transporter permease [Clostridia bacterium]|nr:ABC transporter permease [Clostridia bacterium]